MKIIADTNVLVRVILQDDAQQSEIAADLFRRADVIAVATPTLCELMWILQRNAKFSRAELVHVLHILLQMKKLVLNRAAVQAGLQLLEAGGDFADGVIAFEGEQLGGEYLCTFDKKAAKLLAKQGKNIQLL